MEDARTEAQFLALLRSELARVYHDLSNPLAIVSGNLELVGELRKADAGLEAIAESLDDAQEALGGFGPPLERFVALRTMLDQRLSGLKIERE
jgi:signal transduction histidine kinase